MPSAWSTARSRDSIRSTKVGAWTPSAHTMPSSPPPMLPPVRVSSSYYVSQRASQLSPTTPTSVDLDPCPAATDKPLPAPPKDLCLSHPLPSPASFSAPQCDEDCHPVPSNASSSLDELLKRKHDKEDLADMLESIFALTNNPGARSPPPALHPAQDNDSAPRRREASICGSNVNSANSLFESTGTVSRYRRWQSRKPQQQLLLQQQPRSHYSIDEGSRYRRPNTNLFSFGLRMFNLKPRVGIEQWQSDGFLKSSPLSPLEVAYFLFVNVSSGIDKKQLGEYLGSDEPFNVEVLHRFVQLMDFTAIEFVAALRKFLQVFRLPGEAQKIDRIMMAFARRYSDNNPKMFASSDTAHVLAYSVIMLNTDLHSAQIKRRMTKQEFIDNNQGINNEEDLPREMLEDIYDEIAANEIILVDDHRCGPQKAPEQEQWTAASQRDLARRSISGRGRAETELAESLPLASHHHLTYAVDVFEPRKACEFEGSPDIDDLLGHKDGGRDPKFSLGNKIRNRVIAKKVHNLLWSVAPDTTTAPNQRNFSH